MTRLRDSHPLGRWLKPLHDFLQLEAASGVVLMICAVVAMVVANSPFAAAYQNILDLHLSIGTGAYRISESLLLWINDGLMVVFFLLVGMELKRELLDGHLSSLQRASLPAIAAGGGMLVPALV